MTATKRKRVPVNARAEEAHWRVDGVLASLTDANRSIAGLAARCANAEARLAKLERPWWKRRGISNGDGVGGM